MKLTTRQVADKLHITNGTVANLVRAGKLTDVSGKTTKRHEFLIDSVQVAEFAKVYRNRQLNGKLKKASIGTVQPVSTPGAIQLTLADVHTKLDSLRDRLEQLIALWS
jgi:hypothetical protein